MYQMNQVENFPETNLYKETKNEERKKWQRKAATESQVLLKNEDNILPLKNIRKIAVIGNDAQKRDCGDDMDLLCQNNTNQVQNGFIPIGYGSGTTDFNYLISPLVFSTVPSSSPESALAKTIATSAWRATSTPFS